MEAFIEDTEDDFNYDKRCDLLEPGVMMYIHGLAIRPSVGGVTEQAIWADGGQCDDCQLQLFKTSSRKFEFPDRTGHISAQAKDLIKRLLVKKCQAEAQRQGCSESRLAQQQHQRGARSTPAKIRKDNARRLAICRVCRRGESRGAQHMSVNIW